jgi:predicted transcriptional regulator
MVKTTVYLPEELKKRIEETARREERSEAAVIRSALDAYTRLGRQPRPRSGIFASGEPDLAERLDELLEGFGED